MTDTTRTHPLTNEDLDILVSKVGSRAWLSYMHQDKFDAMVMRSSMSLFAHAQCMRHFNSVAGFIAYGINEGLD